MIAIIIVLPCVIYNAVQTITANASGTRERPVNIPRARVLVQHGGPLLISECRREDQHIARYRHRCVLAVIYSKLAVLNVVLVAIRLTVVI